MVKTYHHGVTIFNPLCCGCPTHSLTLPLTSWLPYPNLEAQLLSCLCIWGQSSTLCHSCHIQSMHQCLIWGVHRVSHDRWGMLYHADFSLKGMTNLLVYCLSKRLSIYLSLVIGHDGTRIFEKTCWSFSYCGSFSCLLCLRTFVSGKNLFILIAKSVYMVWGVITLTLLDLTYKTHDNVRIRFDLDLISLDLI